MPETKVHITRHARALHIIMRGEMDHEDAEDVEAAWQAADLAGLPTTAVDLSQVTFADSMLLNALLEARRRHAVDGRELLLLGPFHSAVSRLLAVSGTLEHFTITHADGAVTPRPSPHDCGHTG
ncbi:STAS domain-containing protein [Streptomyces sp. NPDC042638]|uniref:STAS domain-containing protein n=1 Tax=Streptomyces sp. NPDC042638 TaxID=3154333 RepID=UPI0033F04D68